MDLKLTRKIFTEKSTVGAFEINGQFYCSMLEDKDRGLTNEMSVNDIAKVKVQNLTCIPYGTYEVVISYSNNFKKQLPLLVGVKGFEGIRIHSGNTDADSRGCLLVGTYDLRQPDFVSNSKKTMDKLMLILLEALTKEKIFITITK